MTAPVQGQPRLRVSVRRLAAAVSRTDEHRAALARLGALVAEVDLAELVSVDGEQCLRARLADLIGEAERAIAALADEDPRDDRAALDRLEALTRRPEWAVLAGSITQLEATSVQLKEAVHTIVEDRNNYRLTLSPLPQIVARGRRVGVELTAVEQQLVDIERQLDDAGADVDAGRYFAASAAVQQARAFVAEHARGDLGALKTFVEEVQTRVLEKEWTEDVMARRAELFLTSGVADGTEVPFKVMLKRPSLRDTQETNLHDDVTMLDADQTLFSGTVDEIASAALDGIRAAAEPAAVRRALPELPSTPHIQTLDPAARIEKIGRRMYSLLIPDAMQRLIDEVKELPLTITSNNPELPWEIMHDGRDFLCLTRMFARMPAGQTFPRRSRDRAGSPTDDGNLQALLIHSAPDGDLEAAATEIEAIKKGLADAHVRVTHISGAEVTSSRLTDELSLGRYQVIHYAGHAGFDPVRPERSYLLLAEREKFRAERIQRLLEGHPVVFLNACESSRSPAEAAGGSTGGIVAQAQGLASAFVYGGAQACIGSLWPVFDDTARDFAVTFYRHLLGCPRQRVGEALRQARSVARGGRTAQEIRPDSITWASYALYGDPSYRIGEPMTTVWSSVRS